MLGWRVSLTRPLRAPNCATRRACWAAINDYLTYDPSALPIIQYHAAAQTMPGRFRSRASVALGNATRRALRAIGPQLPYLAHALAMDTACEALGEANPTVKRERERIG